MCLSMLFFFVLRALILDPFYCDTYAPAHPNRLEAARWRTWIAWERSGLCAAVSHGRWLLAIWTGAWAADEEPSFAFAKAFLAAGQRTCLQWSHD